MTTKATVAVDHVCEAEARVSASSDPLNAACYHNEDDHKKDADDQVNDFSGKVKDVAEQIWLAGLGAYTKMENEGSKWFDSLVKDGERLEEKTRDLVDRQWAFYRDKVNEVKGKVEEVKDKATHSIDRIEKIFDERVSSALSRLNIPSKKDIDGINCQLNALKKEVEALKSELIRSTQSSGQRKASRNRSSQITEQSTGDSP